MRRQRPKVLAVSQPFEPVMWAIATALSAAMISFAWLSQADACVGGEPSEISSEDHHCDHVGGKHVECARPNPRKRLACIDLLANQPTVLWRWKMTNVYFHYSNACSVLMYRGAT